MIELRKVGSTERRDYGSNGNRSMGICPCARAGCPCHEYDCPEVATVSSSREAGFTVGSSSKEKPTSTRGGPGDAVATRRKASLYTLRIPV